MWTSAPGHDPTGLHRVPAENKMGGRHYLHPWKGFVYLAVAMDYYSKKIIGYAMADHMRTELVTETLSMAAHTCPPAREVTIFHSARGSQYASPEYTKAMTTLGILWMINIELPKN